jgi:ParB/RepB/Spo0J family partition protein
MSSRIKIQHVDPAKIQVPDIRITSSWDDDEYKSFQESIKADGIGTPLICVKEGEILWLVDGLHRLQEAKLQGAKSIPVAFKEGSLVDAMTRNLYMNRLRGKTKASEEARLVTYLLKEKGLNLWDIQHKTGLSREKLEQLLSIGGADSLVLKALDEEEIKVGHAYHLSRLPNKAAQLKLLTALRTMIPFPTVDYVKEVVDESLEILRQRAQNKDPPQPSLAIPTLSCHFCGQEFPLTKMVGVNLDRTCAGLAEDYIKQLMRQRGTQKTEKESLAGRILTTEPNQRTEPSSE